MTNIKTYPPVWLLVLAALTTGYIVSKTSLGTFIDTTIQVANIIFWTAGVFTFVFWGGDRLGWNIYNIKMGRVRPIVTLLQAMEKVTPSTLDYAMSYDKTIVELVVGEEHPIYFVRMGKRSVPRQWLADFLELSQNEVPYLLPIRESTNREMANYVTRWIIDQGWAEKWEGSHSAKLKIPLADLAAKFDIEFAEGS